MKKTIVLFGLMTVLCLQLCACGSSGSASEPAATAEVPTFVEETEKPVAETEAPAAESSEKSEERKTAESYIDKEVSGLIAEIGEPESSEYASSCLGSGEDGYLYYSDFTVVTYREGDSEVVQDVLDPDVG